MIKAIVFDCFGVFYPDLVYEYVLNPSSPPEIASVLDQMDDSSSRGEITKAEFVKRTARLLRQSEEEVEKQFFHSNNVNSKLVELVGVLNADYKVALLSNIGADMMDGFFSSSDLSRIFDVAILSGNVNLAKPDPKIFRLVCEQLEVAPGEAIMVDDVVEYCKGAEAIGMKSIRYQEYTQFLHELRALLGT